MWADLFADVKAAWTRACRRTRRPQEFAQAVARARERVHRRQPGIFNSLRNVSRTRRTSPDRPCRR